MRIAELGATVEEGQVEQEREPGDLGVEATEEFGGGRSRSARGEHVVEHENTIARIGSISA